MIDVPAWNRALALTDLSVVELAAYPEHSSLYMVVGAPGTAAREATIIECSPTAFSLEVDGVEVIGYLHRDGMLVVVDRLARVVCGAPTGVMSRDAVERALAVR